MPATIDSARIEAELKADADVLRVLGENGDVPSIVRPVTVLFVGDETKIANLSRKIEASGWRILQLFQREAGIAGLEIERDQTTDSAAIRELTETALRIEVDAGVDYDGWGTVAQKPR
jgi:hypothetical protein